MKVCSWNVNSIKARKALVLEWLKHRNNDIEILCFQEIKTVEEDFPFQDFEQFGFECHVSGQKSYHGVATCTRIPPLLTQKGLGDPVWDEQKRIILTKIGETSLINIYAPHGGERGTERFEYKQNWYRKLMTFLKDHDFPKKPALILGDFNIAHRDIDVYSPEELADSVGTLPEERGAFEELLNSGLIDIYRHFNPEKKQFTWWDYIGGAIWKDQGMRIDYILCTKPLLERVKSIGVDLWPRRRREPIPSDHAPLIVELEDI
ncbi:MAG: exodeoxyribonuclease III [Thermodesulfobacteriota bacterium]